MVYDDALLLGSAVVEASRPSLKSLETEGETVLSRGETTAVVDHGLLTREHVPCLEVLHFKIPIRGGVDITRTVVALSVALGLAI